MQPFKITTALLTDGGNLLIQHPEIGCTFTSPSGRQLSVTDNEEFEYLEKFCPKIKMVSPVYFKPSKQEVEWTYLGKIRGCEDFSQCKEGTSSNGGDYGFWKNLHIFVRNTSNTKNPKYEFGTITVCCTTSDFGYSDDGCFTEEYYTYSCNNSDIRFEFNERGHGGIRECGLEYLPTFQELAQKDALEMLGISTLVKKSIFLSHTRRRENKRVRRYMYSDYTNKPSRR